MLENVAWEVPNSDYMVNVIYSPRTLMHKAYYQAGVMKKSAGTNSVSHMIFTGLRSDTRFSALENMMARVDSIVRTWQKIMDGVKERECVKTRKDWWLWGRQPSEKCLSAIALCEFAGLEYHNEVYRIMKDDRSIGYASAIVDGQGDMLWYRDVVKPDEKESFYSLTTSLAIVGSTIDRIQNGSWLAMISHDAEEYSVCNRRGEQCLKKALQESTDEK